MSSFQVKVEPHGPARVEGLETPDVLGEALQVALVLHLGVGAHVEGEARHLLAGAAGEGVAAAGGVGQVVVDAVGRLRSGVGGEIGNINLSGARTVLHGDQLFLAIGMDTDRPCL